METLLKTLLSNFFKIFAKFSPRLTAKIAWSFFCKPRIRKKPLSTFESKLLHQAKQSNINSGEYKISVYAWRNLTNSDQAKTVLLTHGWGGHALNFAHIIVKLLENNFNVVAYDSPAHGNSSGNQTNLLCNTQALLTVSEDVGSIHALIGHSFGAMANAYALERSKGTSKLSEIENIVLIASPNKLVDIFASFTQAMQLPKSILRIFHQKLETIAKRKIESMSVVEFLKSYKGQTLVVHDYKDRVVPISEANSVVNDVDAATLFATTGLGHFRLLADSTVSEKIINFLSTAARKHSPL